MAFPVLKNHIVFASGQTLPLVLGAAIPHAEPACVHIITTAGMKQSTRVLQKALKNRGRQCRNYSLEQTSQQHIFDTLDKIRETCVASVGLNLTGGTKLMTLAAAEWATVYDVPAFYVDTATDRIVLLGRSWEYLPLPDVLDLNGLLTASGYSVTEQRKEPVPSKRRNSLRDMLRLVCDTPQALRCLNACAQRAHQQGNLSVDDRGTPTVAWRCLLELCQENDMLCVANGTITFSSERARQWCNGSWFEEYVQMVLFRLQCNNSITSWASSVHVRNEDNVENELDALFCARNRLFTIECKTAVMAQGNVEDRKKVRSILYKADSLHARLGGVFARAMLCSVLPMERYDIDRAQTLNIPVITGRDLFHLEERIVNWISKA